MLRVSSCHACRKFTGRETMDGLLPYHNCKSLQRRILDRHGHTVAVANRMAWHEVMQFAKGRRVDLG